MNFVDQKSRLRKSVLSIRVSLSEDYRISQSHRINENILNQIPIEAKVIHTFLSMGSEVYILPLIEKLLEDGKIVICPKTLPKRRLENRKLASLNELEEGVFGTKHPSNPEEYKGEIDLFLVPGVAFDVNNNRLGYGGGYYDTLLAEYPQSLKWAICFPEQIVEQVPAETHDKKMDKIFC